MRNGRSNLAPFQRNRVRLAKNGNRNKILETSDIKMETFQKQFWAQNGNILETWKMETMKMLRRLIKMQNPKNTRKSQFFRKSKSWLILFNFSCIFRKSNFFWILVNTCWLNMPWAHLVQFSIFSKIENVWFSKSLFWVQTSNYSISSNFWAISTIQSALGI